MASLDVFNSNAFGMFEMTQAINRLPYVPGWLGALGLFQTKNLRTTKIALERKGGIISLLKTTQRGAPAQWRDKNVRTLRSFDALHISYDSELLADAIQNVRAFGTESELEQLASVVNEMLGSMRQDHEVTHEWHRMGAIKGLVLDADGSTLLNLFTEFGVAEPTQNFVFTVATTDIKAAIVAARRQIELALNGTPLPEVYCLCSDGFWDALVSHATVKTAHDRWLDGQYYRTDQRAQNGGMFEFCNVKFWNYRGTVGTTPFIPANTARFFPVGIPGMFTQNFAPGTMASAVNTPGQPVYAIQEKLSFDMGVKIHTESSPLMLCNRPEVLVKGTMS